MAMHSGSAAEQGSVYTVGMNRDGRSDHRAVAAEDALAAALKVKARFPEAVITYVRRRNRRADRDQPEGLD